MTTAEKQDRAIGCLLGLALGDAVGTTLEFHKRDTYPHLTDLVGGGPFGLKPGQWTDDTSMALCLADSLIVFSDLDETNLMKRFLQWRLYGVNSVTGECFDIGRTTADALDKFELTGNPRAGDSHPATAGNGSLMRLAPAAIRHHADRSRAVDVARRQSVVTHAAPAAVDACAFFAELLVDVMNGMSHAALFSPRSFVGDPKIAAIASGTYLNKERNDVMSSGYVVHTLEAALWSVSRSNDFRDAVLLAANLGDDSDTVAAVTGQLAGALWGVQGVPKDWLAKLAWHDEIRERAVQLFELGLNSN